MLHVGVLPHHDRWGDVLANLRFVVVDEAHVYRGVFGSHVANVLRRLRRLARIYGAEPQFLLASATIANPGELARALTGLDVEVVAERRRAAARAHARALEPGADRPRAGTAREPARRSLEAARLAGRARRADDLLRQEPQGRRADPPLHQRAPAGRAGGPDRPLPGRLHARAAARDRAAPGRGRAAGGDRHRRARAGHRHRHARLRHLGRLPRHRRQPQAAVGPRRAPRARPGGDDRQRGRARPVLHARPRGADRAPRRGGDPRPRQPAHPRRPPARRRLRGADRARRTPTRSARRRSSAPPRCRELQKTPAGFVWQGRDFPAARVPLRSTDSRASP